MPVFIPTDFDLGDLDGSQGSSKKPSKVNGSSKHQYSTSEVREAAAGQWLQILRSLAPEISDAIRTVGTSAHHPCPHPSHGESKDGFRLFPDAAKSGGGVCNTCGSAPDGFQLLCWLRGIEFHDSVALVAEQLAIVPGSSKKKSKAAKSKQSSAAMASPPIDAPKPPAVEQNPRETALARSKLLARWQQSIHDNGRIAAYFRSRGITIPVPNSLKLSPALTYYQANGSPDSFHPIGDYPAIIARVESEHHGLVALHRTYLSLETEGKLEVDAPKKLTKPIFPGAIMSGAIRLYPPVDSTIGLAEGIETALAVRQATNLPVWSAVSAGGLAGIELHAAIKTVSIWADPGEAGQDAAKAAADRLSREGRIVYVCTPNHKSHDWLDVLNSDGAEVLLSAKAAAIPIGQILTSSDKCVEEDNDPHLLARTYIDQFCRHTDGNLKLRYWQEVWYRWDGKRYYIVPTWFLQGEVTEFCKSESNRCNLRDLERWRKSREIDDAKQTPPRTAFKVSNGLVSNVLNCMTSITKVDSRAELFVWLPDHAGKTHFPQGHYMPMENGIIDMQSMLAGKEMNEVLLPHSPLWFGTVFLPYPFVLGAQCPKWTEVVNYNLSDNADLVKVLQEWFGYCLTRSTDAQKFVMLQGDGNNGKTVCVAAMEALLGHDNVSHVQLEMFGQRFQLTPTLGKLLNIVGDVGELDRVAEGTLKSFTGGERMLFDRKGRDPIEAMPTARLLIAMNDPPRIKDRSEGPYRRMIMIPFNRQIEESRRIYGMDKPDWWQESGEMPGIFLWALEGLGRLQEQNGRFTSPQVIKEAIENYRLENNSARAFLTQFCAYKQGARTIKQHLFDAYRKWCDDRNCHPLGADAFGKEIRRVFPQVDPKKSCKVPFVNKDHSSQRLNGYEDLEFTPEDTSMNSEADGGLL